MVYDGLYGLLLVVHLLAAVLLIGPPVVAGASTPRLARAGRADALRDAARTARVCSSATVLVVAVGVVLVLTAGDGAPQWSLGDPWISASFVLWIAAVGLTHALVVAGQTAAADAVDAGSDPTSSARLALLGSALATAAWAGVIALMVLKPGL